MEINQAISKAPLALHKGSVSISWVDYNNHMQDAYYLVAFGDGLDAFFHHIGNDETYRAAGLTFFTAETHLNYFKEMKVGETFAVETQLVGFDEKRLHLFHRMLHGETRELVATNEIMQLHVDQKIGKVVAMGVNILETLSGIWDVHKHLEVPPQLGRVMSVRKAA
jgi:carnitine 3-dehydrogenase